MADKITCIKHVVLNLYIHLNALNVASQYGQQPQQVTVGTAG